MAKVNCEKASEKVVDALRVIIEKYTQAQVTEIDVYADTIVLGAFAGRVSIVTPELVRSTFDFLYAASSPRPAGDFDYQYIEECFFGTWPPEQRPNNFRF